MIIRVNKDGTVSTYNTEEAKKFLAGLGVLETSGESKIESHSYNEDIQFFFIRDAEGHKCQVCNEIKKEFAEIHNFKNLKRPLVIRICNECLNSFTKTANAVFKFMC